MQDHPKTTPDFLPSTWRGGYFHAPQEIRELLKRARVSGAIQLQILLEINGEQSRAGIDGKPALWADGLTVSKFAQACGRKKDQISGVEKALADLIDRELVRREPAGKSWMKAGVLQARSWKYRIDPNAWRKARPYEADPVSPPAPAPEPVPETRSMSQMVILPGKQGRTMTIGQAVEKFRVAKNDTGLALEVGWSIGDSGAMELSISRRAETAEKAPIILVRKPNATRTPPADQKSAMTGGNGLDQHPPVRWSFASSSPQEIAPATVSDPLDLFLIRVAEPLTGDPVDAAILAQVRAALDGTPPEYLETRIRARAKSYTSHKLLPLLAEDAAKRYRRQVAAHPPAPSRPAPEPPRPVPQDENTPWGAVKRYLAERLSPESFDNWFAHTRHGDLEGDVLQVIVPDAHTKRWLEAEYQAAVQEALAHHGLQTAVVYVEAQSSGGGA